jgi:hypothetical protein
VSRLTQLENWRHAAQESDMPKTTKDVLITATAELLGGDVAAMSLDRLYHLITLTQHATDVLLNEIERRGGIYYLEGMPVVPYLADYSVETILTRP